MSNPAKNCFLIKNFPYKKNILRMHNFFLSRLHFFSKPEKCGLELKLNLPAGIEYSRNIIAKAMITSIKSNNGRSILIDQ